MFAIMEPEVNIRLDKIIFHIDVNSAFLSWEAVYRLAHLGEPYDLREIPSAVAGDTSLRRGIILAKSIPAKQCGIQTGEAIWQAQEKCPGLLLVAPDYELYEKCSRAFLDILREYSDVVEQYSIDEAFIDMSASCHLFGTAWEAAGEMRERIKRELGFTVNIGISSNKLLAKMASDFRKPDRVHTLYPEEIPEKMWPLPVSDLFFVGRAAAKRLFSMGIRTIGQLAGADPVWLRSVLKKQGEVIWAFANGTDLSPVLAAPMPNKGYGNSTTIPFNVEDAATAKRVLLALSETLGERLRADRAEVSVVSVGIRYADMAYASHQERLRIPTNLTLELYEAACGLFGELWDGRPIRHLGVHTSGVGEERPYWQMELFGHMDHGKLAEMDRTLDCIRGRYGRDAVLRAGFLNQPVDHMCGGYPGSGGRV